MSGFCVGDHDGSVTLALIRRLLDDVGLDAARELTRASVEEPLETLRARRETTRSDRGARWGPAVARADEAMRGIVEEARAADGPHPAREATRLFRGGPLGRADAPRA